jgi:hypothetical protein
MEFADESGLRLNECLLKWSEVNWQGGQKIKAGKGRPQGSGQHHFAYQGDFVALAGASWRVGVHVHL